MDWLTFFSGVIEAIAWPSATIWAVFLFRKPLANLVPLIRRLQLRDLEITFGEELAKARSDIEELEVSSEDISQLHLQERSFQELAGRHPSAAVIEAWKLVEKELQQMAIEEDSPDLARTPIKFFRELRRGGRIGPGAAEIFGRLRQLRNEAVHSSGFNISEGQALEYVDLAQSMAVFINEMRRRRKQRKGP